MKQFLVRFEIHVDETRRPKDQGFLPIFYINDVYDVENDEQLANMVNKRYELLINGPGITVFKDGGFDIMPNGTGNIEKRIFIPWHMIVYLAARIKLLQPPPAPPIDGLVTAVVNDPEPDKETVH